MAVGYRPPHPGPLPRGEGEDWLLARASFGTTLAALGGSIGRETCYPSGWRTACSDVGSDLTTKAGSMTESFLECGSQTAVLQGSLREHNLVHRSISSDTVRPRYDLVSGVRCQVSGVRFQVSGVSGLNSET